MIKKFKNYIFDKFNTNTIQSNIINSSITPNCFINKEAKIISSILDGEIFVGEGSSIECSKLLGKISVGKYSSINGPNTDIYTINHLKIGSFCSIARNCSIQSYNHKYKRITTYFILNHIFGEDYFNEIDNGSITIENDVWIGTQCAILPKAYISNGVVIGANSVVNSFLPPYCIAVGSPAKPIKYRFDNSVIDKLLEIEWWNWSNDKIKKNKNLFLYDLNLDLLSDIH